jgi:hypothetical protein
MLMFYHLYTKLWDIGHLFFPKYYQLSEGFCNFMRSKLTLIFESFWGDLNLLKQVFVSDRIKFQALVGNVCTILP